ncbi:MAG: CsgG/HfaB family protein [Lysobacterales bacterium]
MSRSLLSMLLLLIGWLSADTAAAAEREKIGILRFQAAAGIDDDVRSQVEGFVTQALVDERRFEILERSEFDALQVERFLQQAMEPAEQIRIAESGARWIVIGDVNQSSMSTSALDGGGVSYRGLIAYRLRIVDVSTGQLAYSRQFASSKGGLGDTFKNMFNDTTSAGAARQAALQQTTKELAQFIDQAFPIEAQILSIEKRGRKGEALEVLIDRGPADGVSRKTALVVFQRSEIQAGDRVLTREQELAQLEVLRSEGEQLSVAKVRKGGAELAAAFDRQEVVHVKVR